MTFGLSAGAISGGLSILGGVLGANNQTSAGNKAAGAITDSANQGISAITDANDAFLKMLAPYLGTGTDANSSAADILGLNGSAAQQAAYKGIQSSPAFTSALQQGERSILSNASATGGLRGGNVQEALAQFSPNLLASLVNQQLGGLTGLSGQGLSAANSAGTASLGSASSIAQLLSTIGSANAGAAVNKGNATGGLIGGIGKVLGGLF